MFVNSKPGAKKRDYVKSLETVFIKSIVINLSR